MTEKPRTGDTVKTGGYTRTGEVKKVKPDGTRVIKTKLGGLKNEKDPQKPVPVRPDDD
jgi:hypothetical protein